MDTGYVLAWLVALSSGLAFALSLRRGGRPRGWTLVHGGVLVVLIVGVAALDLSRAGLIASTLWFPLVLVPTLLAQRIPALIAQRRFGPASVVARVVAVLHPADGWQFQRRSVDVLAALDRGELEAADAQIRAFPPDSSVARSLRAHWWRASGRYEGAAQWLNEQRENGRSFEPALQALEIRVAGELHNAGVLARALEHLSHLPAPNQAASTMMLCAFVGEQELTSRLLDRALPELPADAAAFWRVTSAQRAGAEAPEAFSVAASSDHPLTRSAILRRRETPLGPLTPDERDAVTPLLRRIEIALSHGAYAPPRAITPWVTRGIVAVLLAMFALEIPGGVEDLENLVRLGAVIFPAPDPFNWRLVSAGLLHFGWLHLILNSVAILFFGARLERYLGRTWTFTVFVCSNIGAMALAVATLSYSPDTRTVLIGASGGV
ncbi:MAG: rhomboid family intramembrane serine protease, partial [Myxococcota bacterium]